MGDASRFFETDRGMAPQTRGNMPDRATIIQGLHRAGLISRDEDIDLAELPKKSQRTDAPFTDTYCVRRSGRPWCHLTVGVGLHDRWQRASTFAAACPQLACAPLFHVPLGEVEGMGVAWFDGVSLEDRIRDGSLSAPSARLILNRLHEVLATTRQTSTADAAAQEFAAFVDSTLRAAIFSEIDRVFLREIVLPFVRRHCLHGATETRLTHGDFIARNVLVSGDGDVRLIDCEFSARSHFFDSDLWRWREFSALPPELRGIGPDGEPLRLDPWVEVYSILRHLVLAETSQGIAVAVAEARVRLPRLFAVVSAASPELHASLLWPILTTAAPSRPAGPANGWINAQLFWNATGAFTEAESRRLAYPSGERTRLAFVIPCVEGELWLRFDPAESPGMICISKIQAFRVVGGRRESLMPAEFGGLHIHPLRGVMRLRSDRELNLLSLDIDPSLSLPTLTVVGGPSDVIVEVEIRHDSELSALPGLLPG